MRLVTIGAVMLVTAACAAPSAPPAATPLAAPAPSAPPTAASLETPAPTPATTSPAPGADGASPFASIPPASPAPGVLVRGALAWRGRGGLPPGARVTHTGPRYTPPAARLALLTVAPEPALCAIDERDPRVVLAVGLELRQDEQVESHAVRVVSGAATRTSARLVVTRAPAGVGAMGAITLDDGPDTTIHGGEVPVLRCE